MLTEKKELIKKLTIFMDLICIYSAFYFAYLNKVYLLPAHYRGLVIDNEFWIILILVGIIYFFWAAYFKFYESLRFKNFINIFIHTFRIIGISLITLLSIIFIFHFQEISRIFVFLFAGFNFLLILLSRYCSQVLLRYYRSSGYNTKKLLLVGTGKRAKEFIDAVDEHEFWGAKIAGFIDRDPEMTGQEKFGYPVLGTDDQLRDILLNHSIDEVICAVPVTKMDNLPNIFAVSEELGITVRIVSNFFNTVISKTYTDHINGLPILTYIPVPDHVISLFQKRIIDLFLSALIMIIMSPIHILISILIKLTSPGPVLFKQIRSGQNGRKFTMLKFRTMVFDAEDQKMKLEDENEMSGPVFKIKDDPRITPIGKFLRKTSLDELPQFINVFKGEMSIVGPRPPIPDEVNNYKPWQRRRLSMRPGITCLWQISGRNHISFDDWMKLDLKYIDNWSMWLDIKIMFKTIPVVLLGKGAY